MAVRQVSHFILYALLPQKEPSGVALRLHAFAKASHFGRGGIAQAMTERASPLTGRQGLCLADAFGRERASPAEAAQSLGSDRASDGAALPLGQDPQKNRPASVSSGRLGTPTGDAAQRMHQYLAGLLDRYFLTIKATLKTIASSNSRRSRPVSFLIFSRRYTSVLRWTNRPRLVSETFRLFSKKR